MPSTTSSHGSETPPPPPPSLPDALGYHFSDPGLFELALRHRSWCAENGGVPSNERLEFLGDAVLGVVITDSLYRSDPDEPEGVLARRRAELVNTVTLAEMSAELGVGDALMLGKGEEATGGREKASLLADALEALFGAVYLDGGFAAASELISRLYRDRLEDVADARFTTDHKSRLQELAAHRWGELPSYLLSHSGPEHEKVFTAEVSLAGSVRGRGEGRTKKEAEQNAAADAWDDVAGLRAVGRDLPPPDPANADGDDPLGRAPEPDSPAPDTGTSAPADTGTTDGEPHA